MKEVAFRYSEQLEFDELSGQERRALQADYAEFVPIAYQLAIQGEVRI